jgi:hypothetical protein
MGCQARDKAQYKAFNREDREENPQRAQREDKCVLFFAAFAAFLCDLSGQKLF